MNFLFRVYLTRIYPAITGKRRLAKKNHEKDREPDGCQITEESNLVQGYRFCLALVVQEEEFEVKAA